MITQFFRSSRKFIGLSRVATQTRMPWQNYCTKVILPQEISDIIESSIDIPKEDLTTLENALNKGFACLAFGKQYFSSEAKYCFRLAQTLDKDSKFKESIECGLDQLKQPNDGKPPCLHAFKP